MVVVVTRCANRVARILQCAVVIAREIRLYRDSIYDFPVVVRVTESKTSTRAFSININGKVLQKIKKRLKITISL